VSRTLLGDRMNDDRGKRRAGRCAPTSAKEAKPFLKDSFYEGRGSATSASRYHGARVG
jgi:hypothetical protein